MPRWNGGVIGAANNPTLTTATGIWSLSEVTKAVRAGLWPVFNAGADPYFNLTTLLLPGNGTNGAQNNTFLDSSTNAFTITRNGNTTQGTFTPFSQTGWSNYFDGSGDYLTAPSNAAFAVGSVFTIEFWLYPTAYGANPVFIYLDESSGGLQFGLNSGNLAVAAAGVAWRLTGSAGPTLNAWNHCVLVRSGTGSNQTSIFLNGTRIANGTVTDAWTTNVQAIIQSTQGTSYLTTGYMSNVRIVKGTAVYDPSQSTLTVPTGPLTAISGTSLLTCQSNRFIDNSSNAFTITRNGDTSVQAFSPFNPTAAYSTSTVGGSGYFDGSGDYLTATLTGQTFGTGDLTAEGWFYINAHKDYNSLIMQRATSNSTTGWIVGVNASGQIYLYSGSFLIGPTGSIPTNSWFHVAFVRSSGTMTLYLNGVSVGTSTTSRTFSDTNTGIGGDGTDSANLNGYASGVRYCQSAVYTTTFTPPTAPPTNIANTVYLVNFTNGGIIDNTAKNDLETVGGASISTTQSKFGGGSMSFDGTGDYLIMRNTENLTLGTGDFTIEFWVYYNSGLTADVALFDGRPASTNGVYPLIYSNTTGKVVWYINSAARITATTTLSTGTWYHIAVARSGTSTKMFINGTQEGSTYTDSNSYLPGANRPTIGAAGATLGADPLNGYIDDLRVTKGYARYTANFTAPTAPFNGF